MELNNEPIMLTTLRKAVDTYGKNAQLDMVIEEMSELTKEICKNKRGRQNKENIAEEIADVEIMLWQLRYMLCISEDMVDKYKIMKIIKLETKLKEKKYE